VQAFSNAGFPVIGFDIDREMVEKLLGGHSYIKHIQSEQIAKLIARDRFRPTTDFSRLREADGVLSAGVQIFCGLREGTARA
jgi:UDP-N-acetyl-D-glucosamine dehydrogenase